MSEFCRQCAAEWRMANDFDGVVKEGYTLRVVCEGCGPTLVISDGTCVSPDCDERHGAPSVTEHEAIPADMARDIGKAADALDRSRRPTMHKGNEAP